MAAFKQQVVCHLLLPASTQVQHALLPYVFACTGKACRPADLSWLHICTSKIDLVKINLVVQVPEKQLQHFLQNKVLSVSTGMCLQVIYRI